VASDSGLNIFTVCALGKVYVRIEGVQMKTVTVISTWRLRSAITQAAKVVFVLAQSVGQLFTRFDAFIKTLRLNRNKFQL
jgi:hypothetical protein